MKVVRGLRFRAGFNNAVMAGDGVSWHGMADLRPVSGHCWEATLTTASLPPFSANSPLQYNTVHCRSLIILHQLLHSTKHTLLHCIIVSDSIIALSSDICQLEWCTDIATIGWHRVVCVVFVLNLLLTLLWLIIKGMMSTGGQHH